MNRWKPVAALVFCGTLIVALPGHAQDDGGFGGGGFGGGFDFGGDPGFGRGNRGGQQQPQQQQQQRVATTLLQPDAAENLMAMLKSALERHSGPKLSKDQEKEMSAFLGKEVKAAAAGIEAKAREQGLTLPNQAAAAAPPLGKNAQDVVVLFVELNTGRGNNNTGNRNNNTGNRGNRGGGNNNNNNANNNNRLNAQILRPAEDAFLMTLANATTLNAKQKTAVLKWRNEVIRQRGGVEEFGVQMDEAGFPLTPEQINQLRTVFDESDQKRNTLRNELLQRIQELTTPEGQRETGTNSNQNQNQNNNPLNQLQGLGRVDDAMILTLSADTKQKVKALDDETNVKILRALTETQRDAFVQIERQRQQARQAQIKQQAQQILTRR